METQQYRVTRINPGINFSIPCSGGTDYWPINTSWNCSGLTMYQSTGSQIMNALDYDMDNFPEELRECSDTNPCVILWDIIPTSHQLECNNIGGYKYVKFVGLRLTSGATIPVIYNNTYNELVPAIYNINNLTTSISLAAQTSGMWIIPRIVPCGCDNSYLNTDLYKLTTLLTQDINDMGHYTIWDGNIAQKEVFANFVYSGASNGWGIKLYNTTDFGYYPSLQDSEYEINWGDGTIETLQFPNLKKEHVYCPAPICSPKQYTITITHQTPWGPASSSKVITIPYKDYIGLLMEPYVPSITWTGGTGLGPQQFTYTYTPPGTTATTSSIAYHSMYPSSPLDSGTNINQYSGMGFDTVLNTAPCFTVSGVTDSMLGSFKQYTGTTNSNFLPGGYRTMEEVSIAGDVLDPITNNYVPGILGMINTASAAYTAYTLYSYVNQRTPIDFYDFPDGITIFIAESCGLDALAFGGGACYECPTDTCDWCLTKDEYIDRTTPPNPNSGLALPTPTPKQTQGVWNNYQNYVEGDIVFDKTFHDCCCYMALVDITQTGGVLSEFAATPPAFASNPNPGVLTKLDGTQVHVWEACSPDCAQCPTGSIIPCDDPTMYSTSYDEATGYTENQYVSTLNGCYQATALVGATHPTADTTNTEWDYIGCVHWECPVNPNAPDGCVRVPGVGGAGTYMLWGMCDTDVQNGTCYKDRWLCTGNTVSSQFDCGGCLKVDATHPQWSPTSSTGPAFTDENDCLTYCKPPIWVCNVRDSWPCCEEVNCNNQPGGYTISNLGVWPAVKGPGPYDYDELTTQGTLGVDFHLSEAACEGTNNNGCCNLSKYNWSCEKGCYSVAGSAPFDDLPQCQAANHGNFVDALGNPFPYSYTANDESTVDIGGAPDMYNICGWQCSVTNTPCIPCFIDNCSLYPGDAVAACEYNCSSLTSCYRCDCAQPQNCFAEAPCMTVGAGWDGAPTVDAAGYSVMGPDPTNSQGGGNSYSSFTECELSCACDAGWDCWINIAATSQNGFITSDSGCDYWANSADVIAHGLQATANGPYDSMSACCNATACCLVRCDDEWPTWTDAQPIPYGDWPCMYISPTASSGVDAQGNPIPQGTCGPGWDPFIPFCTMAQCHFAVVSAGAPNTGVGNNFCMDGITFDGYYDLQSNIVPGTGNPSDWCLKCPGTGITATETCECACGPNGADLLPGATHTDLGPWISSNPFYTIGDTVSYMDATNPLCCYICTELSSATPTMEGGPTPIPRQCGVHSPGDGPSFTTPDNTTIVNTWQSCWLMPSGTTDSSIIPTGCTACGLIVQAQYSCVGTFEIDTAGVGLGGGHLGGCMDRSLAGLPACVPPTDPNTIEKIRLQTLANCFSDEDCYLKCYAGCFCESGGNPYTAGTSECVTAQQYMVNEDNTPGVYGTLGLSSINFQFGDLSLCNSLVDPGGYDCCGNPRYNCLSGHSCSFSDPLTMLDEVEQATQLAEMYGTLDACVPLWPSDPGYADAQFRDEWATATTITLCNGSQMAHNATATHTAAYNMCSYWCRWSCKNTLTPSDYCHFVGNDPAELAQVWHSLYNTQAFNPLNGQGCVTAPHYTSAMACWQAGGAGALSCWCNEDWIDCVVETETTFYQLDITHTSSCTCSAATTGMYHTMDECQNPQSYPNVPTSCCDGSIEAWCLAVGSDLLAGGGCDALSVGVLGDASLSLIDTNAGLSTGSYCTDYTTNESGMPGEVLYQQYYANGSYVNAIDLSPNLMYSLQTQIAEIIQLGDQAPGNPTDDLTATFESVGIVPIVGGLCIEPNIPIGLLDNSSYNGTYGWSITSQGSAYGICCTDVNGTDYIKSRVRAISHEYLAHANQYLTGVVGLVPTDSTYNFPLYSNVNDLIKAAEYIGCYRTYKC